jgi:hypothetical protein
MTKYSQIAALASAHSERFFDHRNKCRHVAMLILTQFSSYLEAPQDMLHFVEIDNEFKSNRRQINEPMLKQGRDGYWYFGLEVHFSDPNHRGFSDSVLKFGVKVDGVNCSVKLDSVFTLDLQDAHSMKPLFDDILRGYESYYSGNPSAVPQAVGFIQSSQ